MHQSWHYAPALEKDFTHWRMRFFLIPSYTFCNWCMASRHLTCDLVKWDDLMVCVAISNAEAASIASHPLKSLARAAINWRECSCALSAKDDLCWLKQLRVSFKRYSPSANFTKSRAGLSLSEPSKLSMVSFVGSKKIHIASWGQSKDVWLLERSRQFYFLNRSLWA
jgi:hypothetical protein